MPFLSKSSGGRKVLTSSQDAASELLQKPKFQYLRGIGPFYFTGLLDKLCRFNRRKLRLCLLSDSLLVGASENSGSLSFCIRVEDLAEIIIDSRHSAIGVHVRDYPLTKKKCPKIFVDMPVDVLLFAPTPAVMSEFVNALTTIYFNHTGAKLPIRERDPQESFAATLTLTPEGRRVRFPSAIALLKKLPPLSMVKNHSNSSVNPLADSKDDIERHSKSEARMADLTTAASLSSETGNLASPSERLRLPGVPGSSKASQQLVSSPSHPSGEEGQAEKSVLRLSKAQHPTRNVYSSATNYHYLDKSSED